MLGLVDILVYLGHFSWKNKIIKNKSDVCKYGHFKISLIKSTSESILLHDSVNNSYSIKIISR